MLLCFTTLAEILPAHFYLKGKVTQKEERSLPSTGSTTETVAIGRDELI